MLLGVSVLKVMGLKSILSTLLKGDYIRREFARYVRRHGLVLKRQPDYPFMDPRACECVNFGAVAVADTQGRVVAHAGDAHWTTFTRSTLKALQALPFVAAGGPANFGFGPREVAMLCASHSGESMHVNTVQSMLDKTGLQTRQLQCGCHVPYYVELDVGPVPAQIDERHHNCSGKHAGFLAAPTGSRWRCIPRAWRCSTSWGGWTRSSARNCTPGAARPSSAAVVRRWVSARRCSGCRWAADRWSVGA